MRFPPIRQQLFARYTPIFIVGLIIASCIAMPLTVKASISIISSGIRAIADDLVPGFSDETFAGTTIPTFTTLNAIDGAAHSLNSLDWSTSGGQTTLSFDMDHYRAGTRFTNVQTFGSLNFIADSSDPYELSGYYHAANVGASESGITSHYVQLFDLTVSSALFSNFQQSRATHDENFNLGENGGDYSTSLFGSLTGSLIAGHTYELYFETLIQAYPNSDSGASAVGNITLKIGEASTGVVPEAASLFVWGSLAGLALGAAVIRQRRA